MSNEDWVLEMATRAAETVMDGHKVNRVLSGLPVVHREVAELISKDSVIVPSSEYVKLSDKQLMDPIKDYHNAGSIHHTGVIDGRTMLAEEVLSNGVVGAGVGAISGMTIDLIASMVSDEQPEPVKAATAGAMVGGLLGVGYTLYKVLR